MQNYNDYRTSCIEIIHQVDIFLLHSNAKCFIKIINIYFYLGNTTQVHLHDITPFGVSLIYSIER